MNGNRRCETPGRQGSRRRLLGRPARSARGLSSVLFPRRDDSRSAFSGLENDLAEAGSGLEIGVCGGGFVQGERPVDDGGRNVMAVEQGEQAREVTGTPHGGAEQVELAEVEAPHVEVCVLGPGGAQDHEPTAWTKCVDRLLPGPDRVQDYVEAAPT